VHLNIQPKKAIVADATSVALTRALQLISFREAFMRKQITQTKS